MSTEPGSIQFEHEDDVAGAVAYALYKRDKREYIRQHNLPFNDPRVVEYHLSLGQGAFDGLKARAGQILARRMAMEATISYERGLKAASEETMKAVSQIQADLTATKAAVASLPAIQADVATTKTVIDALPPRIDGAQHALTDVVQRRTRFFTSVVASVIGAVILGLVFLALLAMHRHGMNPLGPLSPLLSPPTAESGK